MNPSSLITHFRQLGVPLGTPPTNRHDEQAGRLIGVDGRTVRRWRLGECPVPEIARIALAALVTLKNFENKC